MFNLTIRLGNAEMSNARDIAAALESVVVALQDADQPERGSIYDANGNRVGAWVAEYPQ